MGDPTAAPIMVAAGQTLVRHAVETALTAAGLRVVPLRWDERTPPVVAEPDHDPAPSLPPRAGLILTDLTSWSTLTAVGRLIEAGPVRWLVLTDAPRGPRWGAALAAGAWTVLSQDTALDDVVIALRNAERGSPRRSGRDTARLVADWRLLQRQRTQLEALTPREHEVLELLATGDTVTDIASELEVARSTVRTQVAGVLGKLEVNSQLAAVAAYREVSELNRRRRG